ncbi:MAG TPA: hypothetical protein VGD60_07235 [Candidatus Acidoferrales bacterium]
MATSVVLLGSFAYIRGSSATAIGMRDKGQEDIVARLFESIRADARVPPLTRIVHRDELTQEVCTIAQAGTVGDRKSWARAAYYETSNPESISTELKTIASFNKEASKHSLYYPRYSVAVWSVPGAQGGEIKYWVGVARYASAVEEFLDYHFTDDVFYRHGGWKKDIAPECRDK